MAHILPGSDGHYLLAFNRPLSGLTYDISQSFMLGCGPQPQSSNVQLLSSALVESGLIQRAHLRMCCDQEECNMHMIGSAFKAQASRVGENGLFFLSYHGPDISWTLIHSWLQTVSPKQVVLFLDSPSAPQTARSLTNPTAVVSGVEKLGIFCANPQPVSDELTNTLGNSLFAYFTAQAIGKCTPTPNHHSQRLFYISDISSLIRECCGAVCSLCVSEIDGPGPAVLSLTTQPLKLFQQHQDDISGEDMIDGAEEEEGEDEVDGSEVARFSFVEKFYQARRKKKRPKLSDMAHRWLEYLKHGDTSPLHILHKYELLKTDKMLTSILRLLVYSLALIQDSSQYSNTGDPNTLIVVYVQAVGVLEHVTAAELVASPEQFQLACDAYCLALEQRKVNTSKVRELAKKVKKENQ